MISTKGIPELVGMGWFDAILVGSRSARMGGLLHHHVCINGPAHPKQQVVWSCRHARCRKSGYETCPTCDLVTSGVRMLDTLMDSFLVDGGAGRPADPSFAGNPTWDTVGAGWKRKR